MGRTWPTIERAEEHFGIPIPNESTLQLLEMKEQKYGRKTHEWIAEGMPAEILGKTRDMNAFRERQAERPPEVPKNIERQNRRSVLRSEEAAAETEPAGETGVPAPVREVISSRGRSLDPSVQRAMEDRMGDSFGDVWIHTGSTAAEACEAISARAFTVGNHIAFNSGEYDPSNPKGQHVLAHELAHVRQQTEGAVSMLPQEDVGLEVDPDPVLERQADQAAENALLDDEPAVVTQQGAEVQIQRISKERATKMKAILAGNVTTDTPAHKKELDELSLPPDRIEALNEQLEAVRPEALADPDTESGVSVCVDHVDQEQKYIFVKTAVEVLKQKEEVAEEFERADAKLEEAIEERRQLESQLEQTDDAKATQELQQRIAEQNAEIHDLKSTLVQAHVELSEAVELAEDLWEQVDVEEVEGYYLDGKIAAIKDEFLSQWTVDQFLDRIPGVSDVLSLLSEIREAGEKFLRIKRAMERNVTVEKHGETGEGDSQADELGK